MEKNKTICDKTVKNKDAAEIARITENVEKTISAWPQWKKDAYNNFYAVAVDAKKY